MHVTRDEFLNMLRKASIKAKKEIRIIEQFHQAPDHPIHPAIKETEYLKGFVVTTI
jgi:23S rRNA (cytosine1962-C5)-methyltransferase